MSTAKGALVVAVLAALGLLAAIWIRPQTTKPVAPVESGRRIDSIDGPELESILRRAIAAVGYRCDSVRGTTKNATLSTQRNVYANCGADGNYLITGQEGALRVAKE